MSDHTKSDEFAQSVHYVTDRHWSGLCPSGTGVGTTDRADVTCPDCLALLGVPGAHPSDFDRATVVAVAGFLGAWAVVGLVAFAVWLAGGR